MSDAIAPLPGEPPLAPGEFIVARFHQGLRGAMRSAMTLALAGATAAAAVQWASSAPRTGAFGLLAVIFLLALVMFLPLIGRRHWRLTNRALQAQDGAEHLALEDVARARLSIFGDVVVTATNGTRMRLTRLSAPRFARDLILKTRDKGRLHV